MTPLSSRSSQHYRAGTPRRGGLFPLVADARAAIARRFDSSPSEPSLPEAARPGATLTEVLMSLLIMSVGILSVMSLFPIALLRTIASAQRTNATLLNDNAVEEMTAQSSLLAAAPWAFVVAGPAIIALLAAPFAEEYWLRERYGVAFDAYAARVPRFL